MIPAGWKNTSLDALTDSVASIRYGVVQIGPHTPDGVPIVAIKFINRIASAPLHRASNAIEAPYKNSRVQGGDVLLSVKGTVGEVGVVPPGFKGNIAREIARIRPRENVRADYLAYQLQAPETQGRIKAVTVGSTRLEFSISAVKKFEILLPPLPEQRRIAEILATWDRAIETVGALIANARAQKKALMQSLLTGKKRLPGFDREWRDVALAEVLSIKRAKGRMVATNAQGLGVPYIGSTSFLGDFSNYTTANDALFCRHNDILMLWDGEYAGKVTSGLEGAVSSTVTRYRLDQREADADFIIAILEKCSDRIRAIREGSGIPHMPGDFEHWFKFKLPPFDEQKAIATVFIANRSQTDKLKTQLATLRQEKSALMQQLLTGKRRVKVAERENA